MSHLLRALVVTGCLGLCAATTAVASPGSRTFPQTYPIASHLCSEVSSGQLPKGLQASSAQLAQACSTLQSAFGQAQSTVMAADSQLSAALQADRAHVQSVCRQARQAPARGVCQQAHQAFIAQAQALHAQMKSANQQYYAAVEAARKTFWSTVHSLRGGRHIVGDAPIKPPA
jgi:hypothetical protein